MDARAERVQVAITAAGLSAAVREFDASTHTSAEAAVAIGTTVERIVKTVVFRAGETPVLVLASGRHRIDPAKVAAKLGEPVRLAPPDWIERELGFPVGGVPPLGHHRPHRALFDETLLAFPEVWAAAGHPHAVFPVAPSELLRVTGAIPADVRRERDTGGSS